MASKHRPRAIPRPTGATVGEALDSAIIAISASGSPSSRLDAELLLAHALGVDRGELLMHPERLVEGPAVRGFQQLVRRRSIEREPVAYLTGRRGFRWIELDVDRRVLIPRPETELVVEAVVARAPEGARVVDVGTGSGAIALALRHERPDLDVSGSDVSADALAVARANGERLGLDVSWIEADLVPAGDFDIVASNPPYVRDGDPLPPDVAAHEPALALFGGADGLDVIRRLVVAAHPALLVVELGAGQAPEVERLARAAGYANAESLGDLAGIDRVVVAWN
ncbi:MAG TPA: peptide chain release factor N(5)-glutamine methyltransferase [Solirubrobacteraceae bacterium]|nr:peptide chain release factor N(5)-glutamine methyltransferase [Solirubrobacteraceae bacterium]